jgi:hypothetical protein
MRLIRPTYRQLDGGATLDMRDSDLLGRELFEHICYCVEQCDGMRTMLVPLPDELIVTQKQFASLNNYTEEMLHTNDRMMYTGMNVMELRIDREVDTIPAIEAVIEETEQLERERQADNQDGDTKLPD